MAMHCLRSRSRSPGVYMDHKLSIVMIGRNEAAGIGACIDVARTAADQIGGAEMIFVDSASTDNTVEIVRSRGVRVLSLRQDSKLCPSAGRYIGSQYAAGEYIIFLDADTLLYKDFLAEAIEHLENDPRVAGVNGRIDDLNERGELLEGVEDRYENVANVKWLRGPCCFYRKAALMEVGSFNPHAAMEEEAELGLRLIRSGWDLNLIPVPMACHTRCYHLQTFGSLISTFKRDIVSGRLGEISRTIAYAFKAGNGFAFCWLRLKTTIIFLGWLALLLSTLLLPAFLSPAILAVTLVVLGLVAVFIRKRSVKQTLLFVPNKIFCAIDILAGVGKLSLIPPGLYPLDVIERTANNR